MLVIFGGLPGTGKSTLALRLAGQVGAVYLRIDTIERAIVAGEQAVPLWEEGYRVAYAVADDNLRLGHTVIEDSVNRSKSRAAHGAALRRVLEQRLWKLKSSVRTRLSTVIELKHAPLRCP